MTKELKSFLINENTTIKQAMKQLDQTAEKILFVVDGNENFCGALTDGDIRRWILKGGSLDESIEKAYNRNPSLARESYLIESVKKEMLEKKISSIPVVDDDNKIIKLLFWTEIFENEIEEKKREIDLPVVIMAGGKGTRLDPFTRILPKPLIPIGDKSIIEIIIEKFLPYSVNHFYISINHKSKIIKSFFEELDTPYSITYIEESMPLGTAGSLKYLKGKVSGPLIVTNCDIIIDADYADLVDHHLKDKNDITLVASMKHYNIPYGVCEIENGGNLVRINEKPEMSFLVNTGMYIVNSETLNLIPENQLFHITDLMNKVKQQNGKVGVYPISEKSWIDTGEWNEYKKAIEILK